MKQQHLVHMPIKLCQAARSNKECFKLRMLASVSGCQVLWRCAAPMPTTNISDTDFHVLNTCAT